MVRRAVVLALALGMLAGGAHAQDSTAVAVEEILVLPFANYSGRQAAYDAVLPVFYRKIETLGLRVMTAEELRPTLRAHRIRVVGEIGLTAMDVLREETGARFAIVGSIDIYEPERSLEVMISARLVDLSRHQVLTAISVGKTVQETEGAFGLGRAEAIEAVIDPVVDDLMEHVRGSLSAAPPASDEYHKCGLVAIVPLEDYSRRRHGAEVLQNLLMSELVEHGWHIVEPGVLHEALLDERQMARGGVSNAVLETVRNHTAACLVVTGDVVDFSVAPSDVDGAIPRLAYGLRLIDVRSGTLLAAVERSRSGTDGETFFAHGREYSMVRLARKSMNDVATWIAEEGDQ